MSGPDIGRELFPGVGFVVNILVDGGAWKLEEGFVVRIEFVVFVAVRGLTVRGLSGDALFGFNTAFDVVDDVIGSGSRICWAVLQ